MERQELSSRIPSRPWPLRRAAPIRPANTLRIQRVLALQWERAHETCPITITDEFLFCDLAAPDIEVVTMRIACGKVMTTIHGGRLDGERFTGQGNADAQHERACRLACMSSWA